jgi:hypothetical protein
MKETCVHIAQKAFSVEDISIAAVNGLVLVR